MCIELINKKFRAGENSIVLMFEFNAYGARGRSDEFIKAQTGGSFEKVETFFGRHCKCFVGNAQTVIYLN